MGPAASSLQTRQQLFSRLADARSRSDELFALVRPEAFYDRPIPERHRIIFYLGHLEAFEWNLLRSELFGQQSFHPEFDRLFAFGIDPVDGGLPSDQPSDWPERAEVERYIQRVRQTIDACLELASFDEATPTHHSPSALLQVAIEHRLMHAETLAFMLHQMPVERKFGSPIVPAPAAPPVAPRLAEIPGGRAVLGLPRAPESPFGWDNEFEAHEVDVPTFAIEVYPVTNGEYLRFVREGGYEHRTLWSDAAWEWRQAQGITHPVFWTRRGEEVHYRGMFAELPLSLDCPVHVSHAEAMAYARWAGKVLPTEAEWHRAAYGTRNGTERAYPWGHQSPDVRHGNFDFHHWGPTPVGAYPAGASAFGVADLLGNGWEWTSTVFEPFPGFEAFSFYPGYSANFFDGKHYVMKGGSARTAASLLRRSFRNWFQPHYPYVYAKFRCVER